MAYVVLSCSLRPSSRSRTLARRVFDLLGEHPVETEFVDLREWELPLCDGHACYEHESVKALGDRIRSAEGVIAATPIYNFAASASLKNVIELTGDAWSNKVVGFLCAAGGATSYMSIMGLAGSLMLDFRSVILPRFVHADESAFEGDVITDPSIDKRLRELSEVLVAVSEGLRSVPRGAEDPPDY